MEETEGEHEEVMEPLSVAVKEGVMVGEEEVLREVVGEMLREGEDVMEREGEELCVRETLAVEENVPVMVGEVEEDDEDLLPGGEHPPSHSFSHFSHFCHFCHFSHFCHSSRCWG